MKIYNPLPIQVIRLQISNQNEQDTYYLNFIECTHYEAIENIKSIIEDLKLPMFQSGYSTKLAFRDCEGAANGKSKSISFKGLSAKQTYELILEKLKS